MRECLIETQEQGAKMEIGSLQRLQQQLAAAAQRNGAARADANGGDEKVSFGTALDDALRGVSNMQGKTSELQRRFEAGDETVGLEQTMLAMQKSQIAFQAALTVRNRLVGAYTEIMNMQV